MAEAVVVVFHVLVILVVVLVLVTVRIMRCTATRQQWRETDNETTATMIVVK